VKRTKKPAPARITPAALRQKEAADYIGVSLSHFKKLRNVLPPVDLAEPHAKAPILRWRVVDLDNFLASRLWGSPVSNPFSTATP
jgi:hypothetical protein